MANKIQDGMSVDDDGAIVWRLYGKLHRDDGPAVEWPNGDKHWYRHGKLHRLDGHAVEHGTISIGWYFIDGVECKKEEFDVAVVCWFLSGK